MREGGVGPDQKQWPANLEHVRCDRVRLGRGWRTKERRDVAAADKPAERQDRAGIRSLVILRDKFDRLAKNPARAVHGFHREPGTIDHEPTILGIWPGRGGDLADLDDFLRPSPLAHGNRGSGGKQYGPAGDQHKPRSPIWTAHPSTVRGSTAQLPTTHC